MGEDEEGPSLEPEASTEALMGVASFEVVAGSGNDEGASSDECNRFAMEPPPSPEASVVIYQRESIRLDCTSFINRQLTSVGAASSDELDGLTDERNDK